MISFFSKIMWQNANIKRITKFGAVIDNVNLKNITCKKTLKSLLWEHKVLCFRNQFLSQKDFIRVGELIGKVSESNLTIFHDFAFFLTKFLFFRQ